MGDLYSSLGQGDEAREAYGEDLIDAAIYARLKKVVAEQSAPDDDPGNDATTFDTGDTTRMTSATPGIGMVLSSRDIAAFSSAPTTPTGTTGTPLSTATRITPPRPKRWSR